MRTGKDKFVLDTFALFVFFSKEHGYNKVERILKKAKNKKAVVFLNEINLGELYYKTWKETGETAAKEVLNLALNLPISFVSVDKDFILKATEIKAANRVSYADAFCLATARLKGCPVITGDPELAKAKVVKMIWIGKKA